MHFLVYNIQSNNTQFKFKQRSFTVKGPLHIEINTQAIRHNIRLLKKKFASTELIAVLKETAYGHGMLEIAHICQEEGINAIALIFVDEGVHLRKNGITLPIYLLSRALVHEIPTAIEFNLTFPINTIEDIDAAKTYLAQHPTKVANVSMPLNTGMNRYGFNENDAIEACNYIETIPNIKLIQIYSHLTHADDQIDPYSIEQFTKFQEILKKLPTKDSKQSIANSAAAIRYPQMCLDQIRIGCLIHGLAPVDGEPLPKSLPLKTAYTCQSFINHIHHLKKGDSVSYGRDYTAPEDTVVAVVAGGYGCGIAKSLSNTGYVLINGNRYPIVGRVCMSQFIVNLGNNSKCKVGNTVTLIGDDDNAHIDIFEHANWANRNFLEILINLSAHNNITYK